MTTDAPTESPPSARHALLSRLIDYAGLFPPAGLDMVPTVKNYAAALASDDAWMLGRLVVPTGRLDEFEQAAAGLLPTNDEHDTPWQLTCLTRPAEDDALEEDLVRITRFNDAHRTGDSGLAMIDVIELRATTAPGIERALDHVSDDLFPFFELPLADDPRGLLATLVGCEAGAKARTGGVTADLYPAPACLARFIANCAGADVPFKATAGLHHPLRHFSDAVQTEEFGFLNVFVAGILADQARLDQAGIEALLTETSPEAIQIEENGIRWRDYEVDRERVAAAREQFATSFGSCSFDEPREDLRGLGLL